MELTLEKALDIAIELWAWMAETGRRNKESWPGWKEYDEMEAHCPLCEYAGECELCPLGERHRHCHNTAYGDWVFADRKAERKKYAAQFLEQLKEVRNEM